jgi:tetratricopeptide (TPR) repeat protein
MKFILIIFVSLVAELWGCKIPGKEKEAMRLADQAMKIFSHHTTNIDSTNRALNLIDSSIKLYQSSKLYFCKYQIYKSKNDVLAALSVCDTALMLDRNNFSFTLEKGCTFEALGRVDSAFSYYRAALQMIDNSNSFNAAEIVKDDEKIVITGLLKDTVAFNKLVNEFRLKYKDSKDKWFQIYSEQLDHFKREDYVN